MSKYDPEKYQRNKHKWQTPEYKATAKKWRDKNREHLKQNNADWYAANKEYRQQYYLDNKEHHRRVCDEWVERNPDKMKVIRARAVKRTKEISDQRKAAGLCYICAEPRIEYSKSFCFYHWVQGMAQRRIGDGKRETCNRLIAMLEAQNYICPYTGEKLIPGLNCSLDHIKPSGRYPELKNDINNVWWMSTQANRHKWDTTHEEFVDFCKTVASRF